MEEPETHHPHLQLEREIPAPSRRPRRVPRDFQAPDDVRKHGSRLRNRLRAVRGLAAKDLGGYDDRLLIKICLNQNVDPEDIAHASSGIEIVSQEEDTLVLAFATRGQLNRFESKLTSLSSGESVTYKNLLYALEDFDRWTPEDRMGWALVRNGFPKGSSSFMIDVELWPLDNEEELKLIRQCFKEWIADQGGRVVDSVQQPHLTIYRVRVSPPIASNLLNHRDVRKVDLLPSVGLDLDLRRTSVGDLEPVPSPPQNAPGIAVLDSGISSAHPVLGPAVGDSQNYLTGKHSVADESGHGTLVAGIALYGDIVRCLQKRSFVPELRLFSGRILDEHNKSNERLIENQVEEAVRYFVQEYGCRVFNLSYGDSNKPYHGRHVAGLAVTLDALSRELGVLFVVPTGNYEGNEDGPDWLAGYPTYLTGQDSTLLDPAPALCALTVGSIARYERGWDNKQYPNDPAYRPVARVKEPSPFSRHGPSIAGAIKPELVDYGGNWIVDARVESERPRHGGNGEVSTSRDFVNGYPFGMDSGTSYAAPHVSHAAARLLAEFPTAGMDLVRAILIVHARTPRACANLFARDKNRLRDVTGYGLVDRSALYRSADDCVTLWAEESITDRHHHFYEIPVPSEFWEGRKVRREISVALAYRPPVRTTRIEYKAVRISFKFVDADSLEQVVKWFDAAVDLESTEQIRERSSARRFSEKVRTKGTVQASTWTFSRPSQKVRSKRWFVVVTRSDTSWGRNLSSESEDYAIAVNLTNRCGSSLRLRPSLYAQVQAQLRQRIQVQRRG